jgi:hypothetical protein
MDELWNSIKNNFEVCIPHLLHYKKIIDCLVDLNFSENPNLLFYGCHGIPFDFIWEIALRRKFGNFKKSNYVWNKEVTYYETPYFFELDLLYPHQPKNIERFSEFIKEIITHPCIHEDRHIIVLKSIEQLSDKNKATALRVLLERFSKNVFFICTTTHISAIEPPLQSRFFLIRCPVFTSEEMDLCFNTLGRKYHPLLKASNNYDFYYSLYISWLDEHYPDEVNESLCSYHLPYLHEFLLTTQKNLPSIEDIRKITQKLSIYNASFENICKDLLYFYKDRENSYKMYIVSECAKIDHMCSKTEEYRKPLYIELFLHKIFYV